MPTTNATLFVAVCGAGRLAERPEPQSISLNALLSRACGHAKPAAVELIRGPAFARREVRRT